MTVTLYQKAIEIISTSGSAAPSVEARMAQMAVEVAIPSGKFWPVSSMIANTWTKNHVISLKRWSHICQPGQHATMTLADSFPFTPNPADEVVIYESGRLVLTGYVIRVTRKALEGYMEVEIDDTYTKVINTFISEQKVTTAGQLVSYWIQYVMGECGVTNYRFDKMYKGVDSDRPVPAGVQLGLRSAHDSLQDIVAFASWYIRVNANGVIVFGPKTESTFTTISEDIQSIERVENTDQTRNVIKVYGGGSLMGNINYTASTGTEGLLVDMTSVIGSPLIETAEEAVRVATYMLDELGALTVIVSCDIPGDPTLQVGQRIAIRYNAGIRLGNLSYTAILTSLESSVSADGYTMNVTIGERCPRISGWSTYIPPVYAGTEKYGVWVSYDKGINWTEFNEGLPSGSKYVKRIASNMYGEVMAIVNNELYYNSAGTWTKEALVVPTPSPLDTAPVARSLVAVDAVGGKGQFAVLVNGGASSSMGYTAGGRSWVYERSSGSGEESSGSSSWTSTPLSVIDETTGSTSYNATGYDLNSRNGAVYVLAATSSGSGYWPPPTGCYNGWNTVSLGSTIGNDLVTIQAAPWATGAEISDIRFSYQATSTGSGFYGSPIVNLDLTFSFTFSYSGTEPSPIVRGFLYPIGETVSPLITHGIGRFNALSGASYNGGISVSPANYTIGDCAPGDYSFTQSFSIQPNLTGILPGSTYTARVAFFAELYGIFIGASPSFGVVMVGGGRVEWSGDWPGITVTLPYGITMMGQLCEPTY